MFNLDKILKRSLSNDIMKMREKFEYCIEINNGLDALFVYLTKKEFKKLTIKDEFGNKNLNIPDRSIQDLWNQYYSRQDDKRDFNTEDVLFSDIPNFGNKMYSNFAHLFTVIEWMKLINNEATVSINSDGKVILEPVMALEDYTLESLINRTDIKSDFIYNVKYTNTEDFTPLTFQQLKENAKSMSKRTIIHDDNIDEFLQVFTQNEFKKIKNGEIAIYQTIDKILIVPVQ